MPTSIYLKLKQIKANLIPVEMGQQNVSPFQLYTGTAQRTHINRFVLFFLSLAVITIYIVEILEKNIIG